MYTGLCYVLGSVRNVLAQGVVAHCMSVVAFTLLRLRIEAYSSLAGFNDIYKRVYDRFC